MFFDSIQKRSARMIRTLHLRLYAGYSSIDVTT